MWTLDKCPNFMLSGRPRKVVVFFFKLYWGDGLSLLETSSQLIFQNIKCRAFEAKHFMVMQSIVINI